MDDQLLIREDIGACMSEVGVIFGVCGCEPWCGDGEKEGARRLCLCSARPPPGSPAFPAQPGLATAKTDGGLVESTPCGGRPPIPHHTGGAQGHALGVWLGPEGPGV